jgi:hypothetical protein
MYCTTEDIKASLRSFSFFQKHTLPDDKELETLGERVSDELNGFLLLYGYSLPVSSDNIYLQKFLAALNMHGVVAQLIAKTVPADARADNVAEERYKDGIKALKDRHYIKMLDSIEFKRDDTQW